MSEREGELGVDVDGELIEAGDLVELGPFKCLMVGVTHSIPEAMMVAIETPVGTILHTGDWKLDPDPLIGELTQEKVLRGIGDKGVLAVVGDSTNANIEGESGQEGLVREGLVSLFETLPQRIVVTMMARHIGRLRAIIDAGHRVGREVSVVGRSLWTMESIARELKYFDDIPPLLPPKKAMRLPRDRVLFIATGTQGETNAALSRMSLNDHPVVRLDKGDTVVFSARIIPGNEDSIALVQKRFRDRGMPVVEKDYPGIYSSGHPCREEMRRLYGWVKPQHVLAVHGEPLQQNAHKDLVESLGIMAHSPLNGDVLSLAPEGVTKVGTVPTAHLALRSMTTEDGFDYRLERVER
jgi:ribonuclease J